MRMRCIIVLLLIGSLCGSVHLQQLAPRKVMIDVSHSMENVNAENNIAAIQALLPNFTFHINDQPLTEARLKGYDLVMVYQPFSEIQDSEIDVLLDFVWEGGGLIVCGEHDVGWNTESRTSFNKLTSTFGITFQSNAVDDPTDKKGCHCTPIIHNLAEHPVTKDITQIVFYKPCTLQVSGDAVVIARGDDDSYTIGDDNVEGEDIIVVAASEYQRGRVVVLGSNTVFVDSFINLPDNQEFSVNCLQWASEQGVPQGASWSTMVAIVVIAAVLALLIAVKKKKQQ